MSSVASTSAEAEDSRRRRKSANEVMESLRELSVQLALLNLKVGERVGIKDPDLKCLDILTRSGPLSASALSKRAGLHPATVTGVLDRLEKGGWIVRERDPEDRRAVVLRAVQQRTAEVVREYTPMITLMQELLENYDAEELATIAGFMARVTEAGRTAAAEIGAA